MTNEEFKATLAAYAEAKKTEAEAKKIIEELAPKIKEKMLNESIDKMESDFGNFTLKYVPVWKYSDVVVEAEKAVDELKQEEKANGKATNIIRNDLVFKKI